MLFFDACGANVEEHDGVRIMDTNLVGNTDTAMRVVRIAQKRRDKQGRITVAHVCSAVIEAFEITGFVDIPDIQ